MRTSRPTLLALRALGLGDLLTAVPALRALARAFPTHRRVLAAPRALAPLAQLTGAVDEVLDVGPLEPVPVAEPPAVAVNLHGRGPQSHGILLRTAPALLVAFAHPAVPESAGAPAWVDDEHEVARWCRLLRESGIAADPNDLDLPALPAPGWARDATVLHPGAASAARRWPAARFAAVARAEMARGRHVVVTGSAEERPIAMAVARASGLPASSVLAGGTDLLGLAAIVGAAGRVVCGDTGVAHLATALRTPSVVLFGPCTPAVWGPPADRPWHRVLWSGATGDPHASDCDLGLLDIEVPAVLDALATLPPARRERWHPRSAFTTRPPATTAPASPAAGTRA